MVDQSPTSRSLLKMDMLGFRLLWLWIGNKDGTCYMWTTFCWTFMSNMTWFSTIQTRIVCTSTLFFFGCPLERLLRAMLALQVESSFVLMVVHNSFVLLMLVHNTSFLLMFKKHVVTLDNLCNGLT